VADLSHRIRYALSIVELRALAVRPARCPICGPSLLLRLARGPIGVRCLRCGASAITLAMACVLRAERPRFAGERVYELSSRGPFFEFLRREVAELSFSEFFDDLPPGAERGGVQCQDVQRLTFPDASYDLVTSTEVFEHVPNDRLGFSEIRRVLRPGGQFIFTVPLSDARATVERAVLDGGRVRHLLPAEYHDDRIRGRGTVLVYRDYGQDITQRLQDAGFASARIERSFERAFLGEGSRVLVAVA
jgi:SAM-dependent methyltransferase